jgi:hypothetical protein
MRFKTACKARNIIDDDNVRVFALAAQKREHVRHTRACSEASRHIVGEDLHHFIALVFGVFAASHFLRGQAVALCELLVRGHAGIDHRLAGSMGVMYLN